MLVHVSNLADSQWTGDMFHTVRLVRALLAILPSRVGLGLASVKQPVNERYILSAILLTSCRSLSRQRMDSSQIWTTAYSIAQD